MYARESDGRLRVVFNHCETRAVETRHDARNTAIRRRSLNLRVSWHEPYVIEPQHRARLNRSLLLPGLIAVARHHNGMVASCCGDPRCRTVRQFNCIQLNFSAARARIKLNHTALFKSSVKLIVAIAKRDKQRHHDEPERRQDHHCVSEC